MLAAAGTARRMKTGGRVRIYNNWSQRNELIEEDEGKKNVLIVMDDAVFHPQEPDVCAGLWC